MRVRLIDLEDLRRVHEEHGGTAWRLEHIPAPPIEERVAELERIVRELQGASAALRRSPDASAYVPGAVPASPPPPSPIDQSVGPSRLATSTFDGAPSPLPMRGGDRPVARRPARTVKLRGQVSSLPDGHVLLEEACELHGLAHTTVRQAHLRGERGLPDGRRLRLAGEFRVGAFGHEARWVLGPEGMADLYRHYRAFRGRERAFKPCPDCPHALSAPDGGTADGADVGAPARNRRSISTGGWHAEQATEDGGDTGAGDGAG